MIVLTSNCFLCLRPKKMNECFFFCNSAIFIPCLLWFGFCYKFTNLWCKTYLFLFRSRILFDKNWANLDPLDSTKKHLLIISIPKSVAKVILPVKNRNNYFVSRVRIMNRLDNLNLTSTKLEWRNASSVVPVAHIQLQ